MLLTREQFEFKAQIKNAHSLSEFFLDFLQQTLLQGDCSSLYNDFFFNIQLLLII